MTKPDDLCPEHGRIYESWENHEPLTPYEHTLRRRWLSMVPQVCRAGRECGPRTDVRR